MNRDFVDMLSALSAAGADCLVVGAHALAAHGRPRSTGHFDLWVRATPENAQLVWTALGSFGAPLGDLTTGDLATPDIVFQIGQPPCRIDSLTSIDGVTFEEAWPRRTVVRIQDIDVPVLGREDLLANKRATGRPQDLADVAWLESEQT